MINIKNLHKAKPSQPWDIKVDRSTVLGNPYAMTQQNTRDVVCDAYEKHFYNQLGQTEFTDALDALIHLYEEYGRLSLFCWCAPKRCHAETIKDYILKETQSYDKN